MPLKQLWNRLFDSSDSVELQDLREEMLLEIGAGAIFVGWIIMTSALAFNGQPSNLIVAIILFAGALSSIWLRSRNYRAAFLLLLISLFLATAGNKGLFPEGWSQYFYPVIVVVSSLLVSTLSIFWVAAAASLICFGVAWLQGAALLDPVQIWNPILLILMTAFASWLGSRQLHSALGWLRSSYTQAREWLEQLRDERMAQARTIKYLEEAYVRIEKLNYMLVEARQAAEEARQLKAEFAANISHELRTPLNLIIGFSETMANAPETYPGVTWTPTLRGDVDEIYRSSRHLLGLIDDILDLSALEVRRLGLNLEESEIGKVVEEAAGVVRGLYHAKRLFLNIDTQPGLPPLMIDAVRIRQVFINLLSNASRFTSTGGVTITTRLVKDSIQVAVADTGIGIDPRNVHRVFEEFGQVDGSISRPHEGTGLGVPLSKRLVEMHGGEMWLESQVGKGTTFYFSLPYSYAPLNREAPGIERELAQAPRAHSKNRKSLLLMESDPLLLRTLRRQLSDYELVQLSQASEIAALVESHHPVAFVVDEPGPVEGSAPAEWAAQVPAGLPVIQVAIKGSLRVAQELGIQDYLIKPISRDHLLEAIHAVPHPVNHILIVDDDIQLVELFDRILSSSGEPFDVLKAFSGTEALQVLKEARAVDLVLLDLRLPDMGGMEVLRAMKAHPEWAEVSVIMASAQNPTELLSSNPLSLNVFRGQSASLTETLNCLMGVVEALPPAGGQG